MLPFFRPNPNKPSIFPKAWLRRGRGAWHRAGSFAVGNGRFLCGEVWGLRRGDDFKFAAGVVVVVVVVVVGI